MNRLLSLSVVAGATILGFGLLSVVNRPATAQGAASTVPLIAVIDLHRVAGKLVGAEIYANQMKEKETQLRARMKPLEADLKAVAERLKVMGKDAKGPEADAAASEYQSKNNDLMRLGQSLDKEMEATVASVNFEVFKRVAAAADLIATRKGHLYVISSRNLDDSRPPETIGAFNNAVLSRPIVKMPPGADITAEVMAELGLNNPPAAAVPVPPAATPAPATAPTPADPAPAPASPVQPTQPK